MTDYLIKEIMNLIADTYDKAREDGYEEKMLIMAHVCMQDDKAQEDAVQLVCDIFDNMEN